MGVFIFACGNADVAAFAYEAQTIIIIHGADGFFKPAEGVFFHALRHGHRFPPAPAAVDIQRKFNVVANGFSRCRHRCQIPLVQFDHMIAVSGLCRGIFRCFFRRWVRREAGVSTNGTVVRATEQFVDREAAHFSQNVP